MKNKAKTGIIVLVLLLAIGFAAVTTNLIINGTANLAAQSISGLVYFSAASTDEGGTATINPSGKQEITFTSKQLKVVGDKATLNYTVLNDSSQYDVDVTMSIDTGNAANQAKLAEYVDIAYTGFQPAEQGNDHAVRIDGKQTSDGKIEITLKKLSIEEFNITFTITLDVKAVSRTSEAPAQGGGGGGGNSCNHTSDGELAYFDPVTTNECSKNTFNAANVKSKTSTCYAWRVINNCDDTYTLQLDHQLATVSWITEADYNAAATAGGKTNHWISANYQNGSAELGPVTLLKSIESATSTWTRVDPITYSYSNVVDISAEQTSYPNEVEENYGTLNCTNGVCTVSNNPSYAITSALRARVITYEDVRSLMGVNNPTKIATRLNNHGLAVSSTDAYGSYSADAPGKQLWWLFENTLEAWAHVPNNVGATVDVYAEEDYFDHPTYWTLSPAVKTPGVVGDNQVGLNSSVLILNTYSTSDCDYDLDPDGCYYYYDAGYMIYSEPNYERGLRPVITVPAAQVRMDNEN